MYKTAVEKGNLKQPQSSIIAVPILLLYPGERSYCELRDWGKTLSQQQGCTYTAEGAVLVLVQ